MKKQRTNLKEMTSRHIMNRIKYLGMILNTKPVGDKLYKKIVKDIKCLKREFKERLNL